LVFGRTPHKVRQVHALKPQLYLASRNPCHVEQVIHQSRHMLNLALDYLSRAKSMRAGRIDPA
jgi:hypothetical protein